MKIARKAYMQIAVLTVLFLMLAGTTYALFLAIAQADGQLFETGSVKIELGGGQAVFGDGDVLEPGKALEKPLTVENKGTADAHYRLYLENVDGALGGAMIFQVYDGAELLYSGGAADFGRDHPCVGKNVLRAGETHTLQIKARMDPSAGNAYRQTGLSFDIVAEAVQSKNNPNKKFPG